MSDMNIWIGVNITDVKKAIRNLEVAFREAGFGRVEATQEHIHVWLDGERELVVLPISAGHGRPQELRNALAEGREYETLPVVVVYVAAHFTRGALEILQECGVNYLDERQFFFRSTDPFVAIRQEWVFVGATRPERTSGLSGKTGTAIQAMLLDDREWWRVTDLAEEAGVAAGTAQAALTKLEGLGLVEVEGAGPKKLRRLVNRAELLDRWAQEANRERGMLVAAYVQAQGPVDLARQITDRLGKAGIEHALTGACAALLVAPHVTDARRCEVWVNPATRERAVLDALGTEPVEKGGNVIILRSRSDAPLFEHRQVEGVETANPLRVYADLLEDPRRGEEQAEFLRETVLKF